ncbi:Protein of unknown function [Lactobacillus delbrueckii subsp. bulgaricus]|nr:Protein of unknown function [Lactobacillus delbrueckii subsp. bulgaricus]
MLVGQEGQP